MKTPDEIDIAKREWNIASEITWANDINNILNNGFEVSRDLSTKKTL